MALFESVLILLLVAIALLRVSQRLHVPYPSALALAGVAVAALPWAPEISIDPRLALALFIAPALLDAAYDFPPRDLRRYWLPLLSLAGIAVLLTTAAVAWAGVALGGLSLAAAIALGAIVAPPDAAAATAMLGRFSLPRSTVTVLKGESLLNDAVALLIFGAAVGAASGGQGWAHQLPQLAIAVPGGLLFGLLLGKLVLLIAPRLVGTLGGILFQFVATFGTWLIADRLHLSAILAVVAFGMTIARHTPYRQPARDRVHSYSVWETAVFVLNVLAFLLVGLQARATIRMLDGAALWHALGFAGIVLAIVIGVRIAWVMIYNRLVQPVYRRQGRTGPSLAQSAVVAWCGMRGLVTLATALALPADFAGRPVILLSALAVVLGTLVLQGITLGPLIRLMKFQPDDSYAKELAAARVVLLDAALAALNDNDDAGAVALRERYQADRDTVEARAPQQVSAADDLQREIIKVQRDRLAQLRKSAQIDDDIFHALEQDLDWSELGASSPQQLALAEA